MTRTCAVVVGTDAGELIQHAREALRAGADMVELRLDLLPPREGTVPTALEDILVSDFLSEAEVVLTLRSPEDGGAYSQDEEVRRGELAMVASVGASWVDLEGWLPGEVLGDLARHARMAGSGVIVSWHAPPEGDQLSMDGLEVAAPDALKVVVPTEDRTGLDAWLSLAGILSGWGVPHVTLPSGRLSRLGRLLAPATASEWVYVEHASEGGPSTVGLPDLWEIDGGWLSMGLREVPDGPPRPPPPLGPEDGGGDWTLLAILGDPISHTSSPVLHHAAMHALGMRGAYVPYRTPAGGVAGALDDLEAAGAAGCNVTIPLKMEAAGAVEALGESARRTGAVNTVLLDVDGGRIGENTDVDGVRRTTEELLGPSGDGRTALVLGTGGAARGAAVGVADWGARVLATGRSQEHLEALVEGVGVGVEPVDGSAVHTLAGQVDLLVHCTSQGMEGVAPAGDLTPVAVLDATQARAVLELVYSPDGTEVVRRARGMGLPVAGGERVLLHQAARSFALWTGRDAPMDAMESALAAALGP